jgi:hypothetical protein
MQTKNPVDAASISNLIKHLQNQRWLDAHQILQLFDQIPDLIRIAENCSLDSHRCWFHDSLLLSDDLHDTSVCHNGSHRSSASQSISEHELKILETLQKKWEKRLPELTLFSGKNQRGRSKGTMTEDAQLQQRDSMDYRKFLRRFAVLREEPILDMDSFDYIPYYYGLTQYPVRMPFIEPLEYSEVHRLDELVIAIDTSGSCSGTIVRRFLEETWSILRQRENFFSKMRLHLIQCDLMIQEHRIFTSIEEWEAYLPDLKIYGHSGSLAESYAEEYGIDFVPVGTGDIDRSGEVSVNDVTNIQKAVSGITETDNFDIKMADVNNNGKIDIRDATYLQLFLAKKIDKLPN